MKRETRLANFKAKVKQTLLNLSDDVVAYLKSDVPTECHARDIDRKILAVIKKLGL